MVTGAQLPVEPDGHWAGSVVGRTVVVTGALQREAGMESQYARSGSLRMSYWRREILQLLLWMQGEGFSDHLGVALLEGALGIECSAAVRHLDGLADEGLLSDDGCGRYRLTEAGQQCGARLIDESAAPEFGVSGLDDCGAPAVSLGRRLPRRRRPRSRGDGRRLA